MEESFLSPPDAGGFFSAPERGSVPGLRSWVQLVCGDLLRLALVLLAQLRFVLC
jgi:hypothetical protein